VFIQVEVDANLPPRFVNDVVSAGATADFALRTDGPAFVERGVEGGSQSADARGSLKPSVEGVRSAQIPRRRRQLLLRHGSRIAV
jgi:hypothetical protein